MGCGSRWYAKPGIWLFLVALNARVAACRDYSGSSAAQGAGGEAAGGASTAGASAGSAFTVAGDGGGGRAGSGGGNTFAGVGGAVGQGGTSAAAGDGGGSAAAGEGGTSPVDSAGGGQDSAGMAGQPASSSAEDFKNRGLVLWLEAGSCDYDQDLRVDACADQSGYKNDALQPSVPSRPLLVLDALNGRPALHFDGSSAPPSAFVPSILRVEDAESLHFGVDDFTVILVARWTNDPGVVYTVSNNLISVQYGGYGGILSKTQINGLYAGFSLFGNYPLGAVNLPALRRLSAQLELGRSIVLSASNNLNNGKYRVLTARRYGNDWLGLRINGKDDGFSQVTRDVDAGAPNQPLLIGGGAGQPLRGDIAELIWIKAVTTAEQIGALEQGLMAKYALE